MMTPAKPSKIFAFGMVLTVAACNLNPAENANITNTAFTSYQELSKLLAKAELGAFRSPSSFEGAVESYAAILGGYEASRLGIDIAHTRMDSEKAKKLVGLNKIVTRCTQQVKLLAAMHKAKGIAAASSQIQKARNSCDSATRSLEANESVSSLGDIFLEDV